MLVKHFIRIIPKTGKRNVTGAKLKKVVEISGKYGRGHIGFTTRQCVEIPWIRFEDIEIINEFEDISTMEEAEVITSKKYKY